MTKSLAVLLLAILLPSLGLGWLALKGAEEQQIVLEQRTAELLRVETDKLAAAARDVVLGQQRTFTGLVEEMTAQTAAAELAPNFTTALAAKWPRRAVGFAVSPEGRLLCPTARDAAARPECRRFLLENSDFLRNRTAATVYPVIPEQQLDVQTANSMKLARNFDKAEPSKKLEARRKESAPAPAAPGVSKKSAESKLAEKNKEAPAAAAPAEPSANFAMNQQRAVRPQQQFAEAESQLAWANADFRELTMDGAEGLLNRYVQDRLNLMIWVRPARAGDIIFGCVIQADDLHDLWPTLMPTPAAAYDRFYSSGNTPEHQLALLDDRARPVALRQRGEMPADWRKPFVATEIGETLPHWEAALYLSRPDELRETARQVRRNLSLLIGAALAAIAAGLWVVVAETRRQLALAQKKTDFVSNVSHELKTPLTSIRMFAELMQSGRTEPERQAQYLRIIVVEAERLTRLINNVLDFARIERKQKRLEMRPIDLHEVIASVWESHQIHLREHGFTALWQAAPPPYHIQGDPDALAQVLVNLLSNAEKYSSETKEVSLHSYIDAGYIYVAVLDRGCGVPAQERAKIFEAFYRAHDSLSSGVQGSGLGLTLAQRIVREHGGDIQCEPREEGGSRFTIRLPLAPHGQPAATPPPLP